MSAEALRVRVMLPGGRSPIVWSVVGRHVSPMGEVVELAAAGRRLVVPLSWCEPTDEPLAPLRSV